MGRRPIVMEEVGLNRQQSNALKLLLNTNDNFIISGDAGSGKSTLIKAFLQRTRKSVAICAPSGMAAYNAGGETIHSLLFAPPTVIPRFHQPKDCNGVLDNADVIIVDEIGTCRFDLFSYLSRSIRRSIERKPRKVQLIVIGDFWQIPPVVADEDISIIREQWGPQYIKGYAFLADEWAERNFHWIVLTEQMRINDAEYLDNCSRIKIGDLTTLQYFNTLVDPKASEERTLLCPIRRKVEERNEVKLRQLDGKETGYQIQREGNYDHKLERADELLKLKEGAPVIALINDSSGRFRNGMRGIALELSEGSVLVEFQNDRIVEMKPVRQRVNRYAIWQGQIVQEEIGAYTQIPLTLGYAMTIHRAQGLTLDSIAVDPSCFAPGQLYTGLTRVPGAENISLVAPIKPKHIIVDPIVREFYRKNTFEEKKAG